MGYNNWRVGWDDNQKNDKNDNLWQVQACTHLYMNNYLAVFSYTNNGF